MKVRIPGRSACAATNFGISDLASLPSKTPRRPPLPKPQRLFTEYRKAADLGKEVTVVRVDISCDLMDEDDTAMCGASCVTRVTSRSSSPVPSWSPVTRMRQPLPKSSISSTRARPGGPPSYLAGPAQGLPGGYPASDRTGLTLDSCRSAARRGNTISQIPPNTATAPILLRRMGAVRGASDLDLHLWAILGSNQ